MTDSQAVEFVDSLHLIAVSSAVSLTEQSDCLKDLLGRASTADYDYFMFVAILGTFIAVERDHRVKEQFTNAARKLYRDFPRVYRDFKMFLSANLDHDLGEATALWVVWNLDKERPRSDLEYRKMVKLVAGYIEAVVKRQLAGA